MAYVRSTFGTERSQMKRHFLLFLGQFLDCQTLAQMPKYCGLKKLKGLTEKEPTSNPVYKDFAIGEKGSSERESERMNADRPASSTPLTQPFPPPIRRQYVLVLLGVERDASSKVSRLNSCLVFSSLGARSAAIEARR